MLYEVITLSERSRSVGLVNSGIPFGTVFALIVTPIIVQKMGWEWAFYLFGAVGVLWFLFWQLSVTARPQEHAAVSSSELAVIEETNAYVENADIV